MMKKQLITIMAAVAFLATLAVTSVQAQNAGSMSVSIPFDFAVSGKRLPAGEYYVQRSANGTRVVTTIRNRDKTEAIYLPQTHSVQTNEIPAESKLVFNKYGSQFFLSQVWIAGRTVGQELTKTSKERILEREIAGTGRKPASVAVAARSN
jgi:frataxin-like iron-binding protein CyaY